MQKNKRINTSKKDISSEISSILGFPKLYAENFLKNTIKTLINGLRQDRILKIDNFGTFKVVKKNKRVGRNPKTKEEYEISSRNTTSFKAAKYLKNKINNG